MKGLNTNRIVSFKIAVDRFLKKIMVELPKGIGN